MDGFDPRHDEKPAGLSVPQLIGWTALVLALPAFIWWKGYLPEPETERFLRPDAIQVVDGDTVRLYGISSQRAYVTARLLGNGVPDVVGVDAPETGHRARCVTEASAGAAASLRLSHLLGSDREKLRVRWPVVSGPGGFRDGARDGLGRLLISIILPDGRTAGGALVQSGHAVIWKPGRAERDRRVKGWCG
ncbi:MAG: hypothetical protein AAFO61_15290 [Pseudomonadota bacterium]